ncbi:RNA-directed DNA polymerase, eukaryota [Tanacetum coccineum]
MLVNGFGQHTYGDNVEAQVSSINSIPYPPGFTPANDIPACNNQDIPEAESVRPPSRSARSNSRVLEKAENSVDRVSSESFSNGVKIKEGGSILEILEEMITVGYLESLITSWNGESLIMGDFNEVRCIEERWGSVFNSHGANAFNSFISNSGLNDIQLEGFSFTWAHPSATKMSKLDRFLMSNGLLSAFPLISAICLDRHLSDHRPILLKEVFSDFGPTPFRFYHSWLELPGFDDLVSKSWNSFTLDDSNVMCCEMDFDHGGFAIGCNSFRLWPSSQSILILKGVSDYRPISLIGSLYKVVTKILASRLSLVISDLISDVQTAFLPNRQILDGPFIINEILSSCKLKKQQAMIFKSISHA